MNEYDSALLARQHLAQGYHLQREGKVGEALREYRHSIMLHPTAEAHTYLGWAQSMLGWFEEAIEQCRIAISLDPDYGKPYNDIGAYLIKLERWEEAQPWLELALNAPRYEQRGLAHYNLGRVHQHFGRYRAARRAFLAALAAENPVEEAASALVDVQALMN